MKKPEARLRQDSPLCGFLRLLAIKTLPSLSHDFIREYITQSNG